MRVEWTETHSNRFTGRLAGATYLVVVVLGIFSLAYVPSELITLGDPAATFSAIQNELLLFKLSVVASLICYVAFLILPIFLYLILAPHGTMTAVLMVAFAVASVPISFVAVGEQVAMARLIEASDGPATAAMVDQMTAYLDAYRANVFAASVFWALWLFPFGFLVIRSAVVPRIFGAILILGSLGYMLNIFGSFLIPGYKDSMIPEIASLPASIGEIGVCLWLLVMGAKDKSVPLE